AASPDASKSARGNAREIRAGGIAKYIASEMNMRMHPKVLLILSLLAGAIFSLPAIVAAKGGTNNGTDKAYSLVMDEQATYSDERVPPVLPRSVVAPVKVVATLMNMAPPSTSASNVGSFSL